MRMRMPKDLRAARAVAEVRDPGLPRARTPKGEGEMKPLFPSADPSGMLMSEKYDGFRAEWDGARLTSSSGAPYNAPEWFTAGLPAVPLTGELWAGRGGFERVQSAIRGDWQGIEFCVFENPTGAKVDTAHAREVEQVHCFSRAHLQSFFDDIVSNGGEGVIVRFEGFMEKHKPSHDEEATVVGYSRDGARVKSLRVKNHRGEFCVAGLGDAEKHSPPAIGSLVTFSYIGLTRNGIPKPAMFLRVRDCLTVKAA